MLLVITSNLGPNLSDVRTGRSTLEYFETQNPQNATQDILEDLEVKNVKFVWLEVQLR